MLSAPAPSSGRAFSYGEEAHERRSHHRRSHRLDRGRDHPRRLYPAVARQARRTQLSLSVDECDRRGRLILSWADIEADCADPRAGFCVAAHEMAHQLDVPDGAVDGPPALPGPGQPDWH